MVSFAVEKLFTLMKSCLSLLLFSLLEGTYPKTYLLRLMSNSLLPMFSSRSSVVSGLIFKS